VDLNGCVTNVFLIALAADLHPFKFLTGVPLPAQLSFPFAARTTFFLVPVGDFVVTQAGWAFLFAFPVLPLL